MTGLTLHLFWLKCGNKVASLASANVALTRSNMEVRDSWNEHIDRDLHISVRDLEHDILMIVYTAIAKL